LIAVIVGLIVVVVNELEAGSTIVVVPVVVAFDVVMTLSTVR